MAEHTISIDVIDISIPKENHRNIAIINQPNPCYGYNANAKEVWQLIQISRYYVYEAGTKNIISGDNYYDYFPEEGGGGGGGGVTPAEVQNMINSSMSTLAPVASSGDYDDLIDKPVIDSATSTESTNAIQNKGITNFVNSSIETATATFRGTYTTIEALNAAVGDKNDYAFYNHTDAAGNTVFDRYKFVPTEQADLPEGYTQLEYIESSGTQYIDTGVPPTSKRRLYIKFNPLEYVYAVAFFGLTGFSDRGYNDPFTLTTDNLNGKFTIDGINTTIPLNFPGVNEFEYNYPSITVNGDVSSIADPGTWNYPTGSNIYLFAYRNDSQSKASWYSSMRLHACKIYDTDGVTLIRDFIPCKNASNAIGLYDLVNGTFYPNNGTDSFIVGPQANGYWEYEYTLNNSSFTADQWATINSGITSSDKTQISTNTNDISILKNEKVDKVAGKGLSTNDYTTEEKTKLGGLADIQSIGDGLSLDNGELSATGEELVKTKIVNSINTASPSSSEPKGTALNLWSIDPANKALILNKVAFENSIKETGVYAPDTWIPKTWNITSFSGSSIWTDGENIYYSDYSDQYVLDKTTSTWNVKSWNGLTSFNGSYIWTDGENMYYSYNSAQYVLDKSTSTWNTKTWNGLTSFNGNNIWTDGDNIYHSDGSLTGKYILDKDTSTWIPKTWSGMTRFRGDYIWTDGNNIYYSDGSNQYVLDKNTSTWNTKTWNGLTNFVGGYIWTDGDNIYYSMAYDDKQYVLDKSTSTWNVKPWTGLTDFNGYSIWTDGENMYYSYSSTQYVLK